MPLPAPPTAFPHEQAIAPAPTTKPPQRCHAGLRARHRHRFAFNLLSGVSVMRSVWLLRKGMSNQTDRDTLTQARKMVVDARDKVEALRVARATVSTDYSLGDCVARLNGTIQELEWHLALASND